MKRSVPAMPLRQEQAGPVRLVIPGERSETRDPFRDIPGNGPEWIPDTCGSGMTPFCCAWAATTASPASALLRQPLVLLAGERDDAGRQRLRGLVGSRLRLLPHNGLRPRRSGAGGDEH